MDYEKIARKVVSEWSYSGRSGSSKGLELLVSAFVAECKAVEQNVQRTACNGEHKCQECGEEVENLVHYGCA